MVKRKRVTTTGKNELWTVYQNADPLKHHELLLELKAAGLYRHWQTCASNKRHNLKMAAHPLVSIFLKVMPETAPYFGIKHPAKPVKK